MAGTAFPTAAGTGLNFPFDHTLFNFVVDLFQLAYHPNFCTGWRMAVIIALPVPASSIAAVLPATIAARIAAMSGKQATPQKSTRFADTKHRFQGRTLDLRHADRLAFHVERLFLDLDRLVFRAARQHAAAFTTSVVHAVGRFLAAARISGSHARSCQQGKQGSHHSYPRVVMFSHRFISI